MKKISKVACREFLEPLAAPNSDCGLFLVEKLKYIVRSTVKIIGHRCLLVLCLYARGETPGSRPVLTFTVFQAGNDFITYDHRPDVKNIWRTSMLLNLGGSHYFLRDECAFYSRPDEQRVIRFCLPYVTGKNLDTGFRALVVLQQDIRDKATRERQKRRELKIRDRMRPLRPLPKDVEGWLRREVVPAYFFYDYQRGNKPVTGVCSACGKTVEIAGARHNADGVCPLCHRPFKMKSNGKRGRLWNRETASVVQKLSGNEVVVRILKVYSTWDKGSPQDLDWYEETRIIIGVQKNGKAITEAYHDSSESVGITTWKCGLPPAMYLYGQNFNAETCGHLYCRNLDKELNGTPWQYCQLKEFYKGDRSEEMEVAPYLAAHLEHPRLEHLVKVGFHRLASDLVYRGCVLAESQNRTHQILGVLAEDIPFLRELDANAGILHMFQKYCAMNLKGRQELLRWQLQHDVKFDVMHLLEHMTAHKMMRYLNGQYPAMLEKKTQFGQQRYSSMQDIVREYRDYLDMCKKERYDLNNSFVLYPNDLQVSHDKVSRRIKQRENAKMRRDFKAAYRRVMAQLDFEMDGMKIVYPVNPSDIVAEGHALRHCVGSYVDRVANQECLILFLRRCEDLDTPFYTIEIRHKKVVQVRGMVNEAPTPEVEKFMSLWEKRVLNRPAIPKAA
jgi:hypothetical protein